MPCASPRRRNAGLHVHPLDLRDARRQHPPRTTAGRDAVDLGDQEDPARRQELRRLDDGGVAPAVALHVLLLHLLHQVVRHRVVVGQRPQRRGGPVAQHDAQPKWTCPAPSAPTAGRRPRPVAPSTSTPGRFAALRTSPIAVQPSGSAAARGERRDQGVVLAAGQHPGHRVDPERRAHLLQRPRRLQARPLQRGPVQVDDDPAVGGEVPEIGEQAVADVAHRRRPGVGGGRAGRVRRRGTPVRRHRRDRTAEPPPQDGEPAGRPPEPARPAPPRPRTGARTAGRGPVHPDRPARSPRDHSGAVGRGRHEVSADDGGAERRALGGQPGGHALQPRVWVSGGQASPTSSAVAVPPIAAMSARLAAAALWPMSSAEDQSRRKCRPSTRTSVLATTRPSEVPQHGRVVPGPTARPGRNRPGPAPGRSRRTLRRRGRCRPDHRGERGGGGESPVPSCRWGRLPNCPPPGGPAAKPRGKVSRGPRLHPHPDRGRQGRPGRRRPSPRSTA